MHSGWSKYAFALAVTAAALLLRLALDPVLADRGYFTVNFAAVLVASLVGGLGPGLLATLLAGLLAHYFFVEPRYSFALNGAPQAAHFVLYIALGIGVAVLGELYRRNQNRLRQSKDRYQTLFDTIQDGFCIVRMIYDDAGKPIDYLLVEGNPAYEVHTGLSDSIGKTVREVEPNIEPFWIETYGRIAKTGVPARFENYVRAWDRWFDVYAYRFGDPANNEVAIFFKDITRRKRIEQALAESERHFRAVFEQTAAGIAEVDTTGRFVRVNDTYCDIVGRSCDDLLALRMQDITHPEDLPTNANQFAAVVRGEINDFMVEKRYVQPDGSAVWVRNYVSGIRDDAGKVRSVIAVVDDITDRKDADDRKDQFLAVLSHELRNPLAAIRMAAKVLERTQDLPPHAEEMVGIVNRQTVQLVRLVDDLLDMNRISRGTFQVHPQVIDLGSALQRALEAADSSKECYATSLEIHKPDEPLQVNADPLRLSQVFSNLISNACKYSKPGSKVDIFIERDDPAAVIRVRDTGVGIPPNRIDKIFEMFAQVDPDRDRRTGGLGIGLALARGIVHMHRGTIEAHSEGENKGSEFIVRLPLAQPRELPAVTVHTNGKVEAKPIRPRRILAVDDNIDALEGLAGVLRSAGHDVLTAVDGPTALSLAAAHQPEAALLDIGMPGMDGYELAQHIRRSPWGRDLTLIALTGWGQDKDKTRATQAGFNAHLTKPADIETIEQALSAKRARAGA